MRGLFLFLVICLLIASANLGLVNSVLAVRASDGGNILGVRDFLTVVVLVVGLLRTSRSSINLVVNRLIVLTLLVALLTPMAMLVGLLHDGALLSVARDGFMMLGWLLTAAAALNIRDRQALRILCNAMVLIGLMVALAVFVEAATHGRIRLVTPADVVGTTGRSTPSGWPLMMVSSSLAQVLLLLEPHASSRDNWFRTLAWAVIVTASLLTQSRTLLVGIAVSTVAFLIYLAKINLRLGRWIRLVPMFVGIPVAIAVALTLGNIFVRPDFNEVMIARFEVLTSYDSLIHYAEVDGRATESEMGLQRYVNSPMLGVGLGSEYRDYMPAYGVTDSALTIHNILAYFLFRYGPVGLALFLALVYGVFDALGHALRDGTSGLSTLGVGLSVSLINLIACAFFGNVFATTYGAPQAMIALGCLAAYEQMRRSGSPVKSRVQTTNPIARLT